MDEVVQKAVAMSRTGSAIFEDAIERFYTAILKPGDTVVDGGANIGRHTYPCAKLVGPTGRVHAFEVIPVLVDHMRAKAVDLPQITLHAQALSKVADQDVSFNWVKNAWGHSGLRDRDHGSIAPEIEKLTVTTTAIDTLFSGRLGQWTFMKLDLEGGEFDAMVGARNSIGQHRPAITFENGRSLSGKEYCYSEDEFFQFFKAIGYRLFDIAGRPFGPQQWTAPGLPWDFIAAPEENAGLLQTVTNMMGVLGDLVRHN